MTRQQQVTTPQQRRGSVLPWFAALLFVFLPLAALVVDLSLARLARRQMQTAVNSAALEGLRTNDRMGAKSIADAIGGIESGLQLNTSDQYDGDMAAGQFVQTDDHREGPLDDPELDDRYERKDFKTTHSDSGYDNSQPNNSFLVRMQRTGQPPIPQVRSDGVPVPFLFGRGGVTAALPPNDPAAIWNRRERGTIVRATAIAKAVPALRVGPVYPASMFPSLTQAIRGVAPFAFSVDSWNSNSFSGVPILIDGTGESADPEVRIIRTTSLQGLIDSSASSTTIGVQWNDGVIDATPFVIRIGTELLQVTASIGESWTVVRGYHGTTIASHDTGTPIHRQSSLVAGTPLSLIRSNRPTNLGGSTDYIPIFDHDTQRIVGFGYGNWTWDPGPNSLTVTKLTDTPYILPQNASASVGKAWAQLRLSESDISGLMSANAAVTGSIHVPALQRTIP